MRTKRAGHNPMKGALDVVAKVLDDPDAFPSDFVVLPLRGDMAAPGDDVCVEPGPGPVCILIDGDSNGDQCTITGLSPESQPAAQ